MGDSLRPLSVIQLSTHHPTPLFPHSFSTSTATETVGLPAPMLVAGISCVPVPPSVASLCHSDLPVKLGQVMLCSGKIATTSEGYNYSSQPPGTLSALAELFSRTFEVGKFHFCYKFYLSLYISWWIRFGSSQAQTSTRDGLF